MYKTKNIKHRIIANLKFGIIVVIFAQIAIFFSSCSKGDKNNSPTSDDGTVQYKVDGNLVMIKSQGITSSEYGVFKKQLQSNSIPQTRYLFFCQKGNNIIYQFAIPTDSLQIQDYILDTGTYRRAGGLVTNEEYNGHQSAILLGDDYMKVSITSYSNGYISGTFNAKLSPIDAVSDNTLQGTTDITEGTFNNIKCTY